MLLLMRASDTSLGLPSTNLVIVGPTTSGLPTTRQKCTGANFRHEKRHRRRRGFCPHIELAANSSRTSGFQFLLCGLIRSNLRGFGTEFSTTCRHRANSPLIRASYADCYGPVWDDLLDFLASELHSRGQELRQQPSEPYGLLTSAPRMSASPRLFANSCRDCIPSWPSHSFRCSCPDPSDTRSRLGSQ